MNTTQFWQFGKGGQGILRMSAQFVNFPYGTDLNSISEFLFVFRSPTHKAYWTMNRSFTKIGNSVDIHFDWLNIAMSAYRTVENDIVQGLIIGIDTWRDNSSYLPVKCRFYVDNVFKGEFIAALQPLNGVANRMMYLHLPLPDMKIKDYTGKHFKVEFIQ